MSVPSGFPEVPAKRSLAKPPTIGVVIPTKDRGDLVVRTIQSILSGDLFDIDLVVVDQSESDDTQLAVEEFLSDKRFRYIRSKTRGISTARNIGVGYTSAAIIANTDDDCEAPPDWLTSLNEAFSIHPEAAIILGNVQAASHSPDGFIPAYQVKKPLLVRGISQKYRVEGMGACLAYRADVWKGLNGFDQLLGTGAQFRSAEEFDFILRALGQGHAIYETPKVSVVHHGFRKWEDADRLMENYLYGVGTVSAKTFRRHPGAYSSLLVRLAVRWAFGKSVVDFGHKPKARRLRRLRGFMTGFGAGWTRAVDTRDHFIP